MPGLNDLMQFDHVIRVLPDRTVVDEPGVYAPELYDGETPTGWTLLDGYSGQDRYAGPIMHNSEYIGGRMEEDILSTPGVYVALVCDWTPKDGDEDDDTAEGWAVARRDEET